MNNNYIKLFAIIFFIFLSAVFTSLWLHIEPQVYHCDKTEYQFFYYEYCWLFLHKFNFALKCFFSDIYHLGRNPFLTIFLLPFYVLFGKTRFGYVLGIEILFMLPVMIMIFNLAKQYIVKNSIIRYLPLLLAILLMIFFNTGFWYASLSGIPDIAGLIPFIGAIFIYQKIKIEEKGFYKQTILIALLLYLSFLIRRWYFVADTAFLLSAIAVSNFRILEGLKNQKNKLKIFTFKNLELLKKIIFISLIMLSCGLLFQFNFVYTDLLQPDVIEEFELYEVPLLSQIKNLYGIIGPVLLLLIAGGIFCTFRKKYRYFGIFCVFNLFIYLLIFLFTQIIWHNHMLVVVLWSVLIIMFLFDTVYFILNKNSNHSVIVTFTDTLYIIIKKKLLTAIIFFIISLYLLFNFLSYFFLPQYKYNNFLFPQYDVRNEFNRNYNDIKPLWDFIYKTYKKNPNDTFIMFGGDSSLIDYWTLRSISNDNEIFINNFKESFLLDDVDQVDLSFLNCKYIILIQPMILYGFDEEDCQIVSAIYRMFGLHKGIANSYKEVPKEFKFTHHTGNVYKVVIYKKTQKISNKAIIAFVDYAIRLQPDNKVSYIKQLKELGYDNIAKMFMDKYKITISD